MEDKDIWKNVYIYGKDYAETIRQYIADKISSGNPLSVSDFATIDVLRPTKNDVIGDFLRRYNLTNPIKILDMGCGLGGTSRYLASFGHSVIGCDVLPQYIELGGQINSLVNLSEKITLQNKGIFDAEVDPSNIDLVIVLGVILILPGQEVITKLASYTHVGGLFYIEDYFLDKESQLTDREKELLNTYHKAPFRRRSDFLEQFRIAGLEVVEFIDMGKTCSEFAWVRAERILNNEREGKSTEAEVMTYGVLCPQLLAHLEDIPEDELIRRFPMVCERIGTDKVYSADKLLRWVGWVLRKIN